MSEVDRHEASDPQHPAYLDEKAVRDEITRHFDVCNGCRRCSTSCTSFPTLFEMLDARPGSDAGRLTPAQQDRIVDECFQCGRCAEICPYAPELDALAIDVPRLIQRAVAMRRHAGQTPLRRRVTAGILGRPGPLGWLATASPVFANAIVGGRPGSLRRRALAVLTGVTAARSLPTFDRRRFSGWFRHRDQSAFSEPQIEVTLVPTCLVEYHAPWLGADLVEVYGRNGIRCRLGDIGCCGAPSLHAGDAGRFARFAERNVGTLAAHPVDRDIVVVEPSCARAIAEYPRFVSPDRRPDAERVAARVVGVMEPLARRHRDEPAAFDARFDGVVPDTVTYVVDHGGRPDIDSDVRHLLALTGAHVEMVEQPSGVGGLWSLRAAHDPVVGALTEQLAGAITDAGGDRSGDAVVVGDSILTDLAVADATGLGVSHPIALLARAYGIAARHERRTPSAPGG